MRTVEEAIQLAVARLQKDQKPDGHWCYPLEADATITAEYIIFKRLINQHSFEQEKKLLGDMLSKRNLDGSWSLYDGGPGDLSCTIKAYIAFVLHGEQLDKTAAWVRLNGGAERSNVFTRILLYWLFSVPKRAIPYMPVELVLAPSWFPFHIHKVAYWSRCVMIPLMVLYSTSFRKTVFTEQGTLISTILKRELFNANPFSRKTKYDYIEPGLQLRKHLLLGLERITSKLSCLIPKSLQKRALRKAYHWLLVHANGTDGVGAIFPAMVATYFSFLAFDDKAGAKAQLKAIDDLVYDGPEGCFVQPCVSPVWDTGLASWALIHAGVKPSTATRAWLENHRCQPVIADWKHSAKHTDDGAAWAFQYKNDFYPDVDDTALVAALLGDESSANFLQSVQSSNGGWGAFDRNNDSMWLNDIPFADHGALLDPPTVDVTARCVWYLRRIGEPCDEAIDFILDNQDPNGGWWGRWGTNYLWGTWSVSKALSGISLTLGKLKAISFLLKVQYSDGSFGECNRSYYKEQYVSGQPNAFHTALGLMSLLNLGVNVDNQAVKKAAIWLINSQQDDGGWKTEGHNAPGFPKVFHLKYWGYSRYFPLWALALYHNHKRTY